MSAFEQYKNIVQVAYLLHLVAACCIIAMHRNSDNLLKTLNLRSADMYRKEYYRQLGLADFN